MFQLKTDKEEWTVVVGWPFETGLQSAEHELFSSSTIFLFHSSGQVVFVELYQFIWEDWL